MNYTSEQNLIINSDQKNICVNAGPGMGKTHLLLGIAEKEKENNKGLLCFNNPIRKEILEKVQINKIENMEVNTFHSLAFHSLKKRGEINNFSERNFDDPLDYFSMLQIMKTLEFEDITSNEINTILYIIRNFCSSDKKFKEYFSDKFQNYKQKIINIFTYLLNNPKAPMFHEFYIKVYQLILLDDKIKNYDCLMVDEYQDVSSCYLSIIENIQKNKIVKVGDALQKIYGYNGALGMEEHNFRLSKSFRIGNETANLCNKLIDMFIKDKNLYMTGVNKNQTIADIDENEKKTIIFRTNKSLILRLIQETKKGKKCAVSETLYNEIYNIYKLINVSIFFPYYFRGIKYTSKQMIYEWYEKSKNQTLKKTIEFIEEYGDSAKNILHNILENLISEEEADIYFTTTHRSKGLEFENVEIADDFPTIEKLLYKRDNFENYIDEVYIIYVAITRSYGKLQLNNDLKKLLFNGG